MHADLLEQIARMQVEFAATIKRMEEAHSAQIAALRVEIEELQARIGRRSRNSSRPPSSDPPWEKRSPRKKSSGRKPGGQPGHKGKTRPLIPTDDVDRVVVHDVTECPGCGGTDLEQLDVFRHQVTEIPPVRALVTEHQVRTVRCRGCGEYAAGELPADVARSQFGPRVHALVAHLSGGFRLTHREIKLILGEVFDVELGLGSVTAIQRRVTEALEAPFRAVQRAVRQGPAAYIDETSWREFRCPVWMWTAHFGSLVVYHIDRRRNRRAFGRLMAGSFHGVRIVDRLAVHDKVKDALRQICNAHLLRDFEGFVTGPRGRRGFGRRGKAIVQQLLKLWRRFSEQRIDRDRLRQECDTLQSRMVALLDDAKTHAVARVRRFAAHLRKQVACMFTFARVSGIEPTSNAAERMLRCAVLWRKGSFGSHSKDGSRFVSRFLTISRSLRLQGRDVMEFLVNALDAHANARSPPEIVPATN